MCQRAQIWAAGKFVSKINSDAKFREASSVQCSFFRTPLFWILLNVQSQVLSHTSRLRLIPFLQCGGFWSASVCVKSQKSNSGAVVSF